ncbi:MAG TPA: cytochrome c [Acetobacteraceae bacterium]|nr:cytochrome c [Acetobacteraceae bacterium]
MTSKLLLLGVAAACVAGVARAAAPPPDLDIIATRQAGQALVGGTFIGLLQAAKNKVPDVKPFAPAARALTEWEGEFLKMFPPGSEHGHNTKALPAVWTDRATFEKDARNLVEQAAKLQKIAESGDQAAFAQQVQVLGEACKTCHQQFRAR